MTTEHGASEARYPLGNAGANSYAQWIRFQVSRWDHANRQFWPPSSSDTAAEITKHAGAGNAGERAGFAAVKGLATLCLLSGSGADDAPAFLEAVLGPPRREKERSRVDSLRSNVLKHIRAGLAGPDAVRDAVYELRCRLCGSFLLAIACDVTVSTDDGHYFSTVCHRCRAIVAMWPRGQDQRVGVLDLERRKWDFLPMSSTL